MTSTKEISRKSDDIISDSELTEEQVVERLKELKESIEAKPAKEK